MRIHTAFRILAVLAAAAPAAARAEIRLSAPPAVNDPRPGNVDLQAVPGQPLTLEASVFTDGAEDENASASLEWHVKCPADGSACAPEAFTETEGGRGRSFAVPADFTQIEIAVSLPDTGETASFLLHPADASGVPLPRPRPADLAGSASPGDSGSEGSDAPDTGWHASWRPPGRTQPATNAASPAPAMRSGSGFSGGGGGSDSDDSGPSWHHRRSHHSRYRDDSYFSGGYGGGSGGAGEGNAQIKDPQRDVAVLTCSSAPGPDGNMHVVCEDPSKKVLHVSKAAKPAKLSKAPKAPGKKNKPHKRVAKKKAKSGHALASQAVAAPSRR